MSHETNANTNIDTNTESEITEHEQQ